jgi:hypothetical protein
MNVKDSRKYVAEVVSMAKKGDIEAARMAYYQAQLVLGIGAGYLYTMLSEIESAELKARKEA